MDVRSVNSLLVADTGGHGVEVRLDGHVFRSKLEARWWRAFREQTGLQVLYEPIKYRREIEPVGGGKPFCVSYVPDFVLAPAGHRFRRRIKQQHLRGLVHVECKPTAADPPNLLQLVPDPVVLLCGYPDEGAEAFVVESKVEFRGSRRWRMECREFHGYGADWQLALVHAATGEWRDVPAARAIGVQKFHHEP